MDKPYYHYVIVGVKDEDCEIIAKMGFSEKLDAVQVVQQIGTDLYSIFDEILVLMSEAIIDAQYLRRRLVTTTEPCFELAEVSK